MLTCPKCRKQNPPDAAFCGYCGSPMAPQAAAAKTMFGYGAEKAAAATPAAKPAPAPQPVAASPQPSQLIAAKYWLGEMIKRLPAGDLYLAKDVKQEGSIDLLLVNESVFPSPLDMERARRELRQLQKVDCPAIVRVLDHGKAEDGRLFVALEHVEGRSLDDIVGRGALDLAEAQRVIRGVGTGLAEAQKMGVIHRDIAPFNILLSDGGEVKVRGFGVAAPVKRHVFGTAEFISPEQASGRPVDQRSNIYSLGALMFYMLTGEPPFRASTPEDLLEKHQKQEPVSPRSVRPELQLSPRAEALILKALAKSSSRRHLTLRQFLREVESLSPGAEAAAAAVPVEQVQPASFVTPLHGITALTGGAKPPSSEMLPLAAKPMLLNDGAAATIIDPPATKTIPEAPAVVAPTLIAPTPAPAPVMPSPAAPPAPAPAPAAPSKRVSQITGEVQSAVALKPATIPPGAVPLTKPKAASATVPKAPQAAAPPPAAPGAASAPAPGKPGFRETMWFFKGEVESAMAETGTEAPPSAEVSPVDLANKYADDGSMSEEEARRLSLRSGKTQMMMQQGRIPSGAVPGKKVRAEELIDEINKGKRLAIYIGIPVLVAALAALVVWLLMN